MSTMTASYPPVDVQRRLTRSIVLYAKEVKYEFLKLLRTKAFSLSVIGFPVMFYLVFGLSNHGVRLGSVEVAKYLLAGYACSGMASAALFGIGVGLATERAAGWLELKRASPMPPMAYLLAKCVAAQVFGVMVVAVLVALSTSFGGVHLSVRELMLLLAMPFAATIPFASMSLLIALVVPPNAASGVVNILYMPMAVASGLWLPVSMLPHWMQAIAPALPAYHLAQITLSIFGYQQPGPMAGHYLALIGFTLIMLGACWAVFHRSEQQI